MAPTAVALICTLIFLAIIVWDLYLYLDGKPRNSISQVVIDLTKKTPLVPWAIGFLFGALTMHFFD